MRSHLRRRGIRRLFRLLAVGKLSSIATREAYLFLLIGLVFYSTGTARGCPVLQNDNPPDFSGVLGEYIKS